MWCGVVNDVVQAERMISHAVKSGPRAEQTSKKGTMAFRLEKMCSHMGVTLEVSSDQFWIASFMCSCYVFYASALF